MQSVREEEEEEDAPQHNHEYYKGGAFTLQNDVKKNTPEAIIPPVCGSLMWQQNNRDQSQSNHTHPARK